MDQIRQAQTLAGEQVVTKHLTSLGLAPVMDAVEDSAKYRLWDRSTLEFFAYVTDMQNHVLKKKLAKHEAIGEFLAKGLQFNVDVVMEMAQELASTWSVVGGHFDDGTALERAEELKQAIRDMLTVYVAKANDAN
jgi:hypothetical protein